MGAVWNHLQFTEIMNAFINIFVNLVLVSKDTEQSMEGQEQEVPFPLLENTLTSCMLFLPWFFWNIWLVCNIDTRFVI